MGSRCNICVPQNRLKKNDTLHAKSKWSRIYPLLQRNRTASHSYSIDQLNRAVAQTAIKGLGTESKESIFTKLNISQPGDKYEKEADRVADTIMSMPQEEEKESVQTKSISESITSYVQRECCKEEKEGVMMTSIQREEDSELQAKALHNAIQLQDEEIEEGISAKSESGKTGTVTQGIESGIQSIRGKGEPLSNSNRSYYESRFGADFSDVRVHTDSKAEELAHSVNAKAFTVGKDVVFGKGEYSPGTSDGKRLMAHELTHVVQQRSIVQPYISRWSAEDHGKLTKETIDSFFKDTFSINAINMLAYYSGEMDIRGCNYVWFATPKVPIIGIIKESNAYYKLSEHEGPNHGEANLYKYTNRTILNDKRMKEYQTSAINLANGHGINDQSLLELGFALHVGQDRGAHDEGLPGRGHARKNWNPDDLNKNTEGKIIAINNSKLILQEFYTKIGTTNQKQLRSKMLPLKSFDTGIELVTGFALTGKNKLFYIGQYGYGILPDRLFGIWSPVLKAGYGYAGGNKHLITMSSEVGLRLVRPTRLIYVDVLTGAALGYNISDKRMITGISTTISGHYTGNKIDLGIILNNIYDFISKENVTIIGVSGRF